ncbi:uncharacterized protein LOC133035570 [Cannabis sativa]|uniref:uncharacterized protein LOC133035570 n=1 Tax=Cannabis sativa TaxID=3483 RepID=UPI0029C9BC74|nr:uncharacterized protein LOC133035570 [Cannabis sativa]
MMTNRLCGVLSDLILKEQSAFILGRLITDNAKIGFEYLNFTKHHKKGMKGFLALKADIAKAYDRVEWTFLVGIMCRLGFLELWVSLVFHCISFVRYYINVNGQKLGDITSIRGIRQRDHLSPFLFLIWAEGLSSVFKHESIVGGIQGLPCGRRSIRDKNWKKLFGWKSKNFLAVGRVVLLKSFVQAIQTYAMNLFLLLVKLIEELHYLCAHFWWGGNDNNRNVHWCIWERLYWHKSDGGMGFRGDLDSILWGRVLFVEGGRVGSLVMGTMLTFVLSLIDELFSSDEALQILAIPWSLHR